MNGQEKTTRKRSTSAKGIPITMVGEDRPTRRSTLTTRPTYKEPEDAPERPVVSGPDHYYDKGLPDIERAPKNTFHTLDQPGDHEGSVRGDSAGAR